MSNILIVENHPGNRDALYRLLQLKGYTVYSVESGQEALAFLQKAPSTLVLLDYQMPGMSGLEVLQIIDKDPLLRLRHRFILLTAAPHAFSPKAQQICQALNVPVIIKPYSIKAFLVQIESTLNELAMISATHGQTQEA